MSLHTIAERTKLTVDGAEFLLMKALSLHLIEGIIDEVDETVQVAPCRRPPPLALESRRRCKPGRFLRPVVQELCFGCARRLFEDTPFGRILATSLATTY